MTRALALVAALAALTAGAALGAAPKPDAHDRALARMLDAKVKTFREIASQQDDSNFKQSLNKCPVVKKDPSQAFAALFALLPALLIELVNDYGTEMRGLQQTLADMHPHSALFARWTAAEATNFDLILQFDNHGKKIDLCEAATVMLDKKSTAADVHRVLGIDPRLIGKLFTSGGASSTATKLDPQMERFFVAAGLSAKDAKTLTS
jgi:hypothetical protein